MKKALSAALISFLATLLLSAPAPDRVNTCNLCGGWAQYSPINNSQHKFHCLDCGTEFGTEPHSVTDYRQTGSHATHEKYCAACVTWIAEGHTWISIAQGYVCRFCYFDP